MRCKEIDKSVDFVILPKKLIFEFMDIQVLFNNYSKIKELEVDDKLKIRILTVLMGASEVSWRVVGITIEALKVFNKHEYKYKSGMRINRSHYPKSRKEFYTEMLLRSFSDCNGWWNYYKDNDITILATSSENTTNEYSDIIYIDGSLDLFRNKFISWRHTKKERAFLENLYFESVKA